jgi:4'-phosphopantetheinyl transferase
MRWAGPIPDAGQIAARCFSARETAEFNSLTDEQKPLAFFCLWTRKEAVLKATGAGITESLAATEVSFLPGERARVRAVGGDERAGESWTLEDLTPCVGYAAAVAARATGLSVRCWRWPD